MFVHVKTLLLRMVFQYTLTQLKVILVAHLNSKGLPTSPSMLLTELLTLHSYINLSNYILHAQKHTILACSPILLMLIMCVCNMWNVFGAYRVMNVMTGQNDGCHNRWWTCDGYKQPTYRAPLTPWSWIMSWLMDWRITLSRC